jgi:hypothetical protein
MKKINSVIIGVLALSFSHLWAQSSDGETMKEFLKGIPAFENEKISSLVTIQSINNIAKQKAAKTISITGTNIRDVLTEAKQYKYCIIIVEAHTIVKVTDFENCSQSSSWGICMPYGEGYIRKGSFVSSKDYINNIIGKPDEQARTMYLFN